jgi:signal transduction histidine kinase
MVVEKKLIKWIAATAGAPRASARCYILAAALQLGLSFLSWRLEGESEALFTILHVSLAFMVTLMGGRGPGYFAGILAALSVDVQYISPENPAGSPEAIAFFALTFLFIYSTLFLVGTLQKAAKEALGAKQLADTAVKDREEALAVIAHDLRQPIATLLLQAQLGMHALTRKVPIDAIHKLNQAITTLRRMDRLIQDLLDSSKVDSESLRLALEPVDLTGLTQGIMNDHHGQARQKNIRMRLHTKRNDLPSVVADKNRLIRVVSNLLANSLKFAPQGGEIEIRIEQPELDQVQFCIMNNGPHIPNDQVQNLFKRNWQDKKTAHLGSGLGLYICQGIIKAHQGSIWYEPTDTRGPCFCFRLPASGIHQRELAPTTSPPLGRELALQHEPGMPLESP